MALCGCERKPDYEFHSGSDGQVLWRCNRKTGEVKIFTSYTDTVQMWRGASRDFIFNKQTGQIWRYYQNGTNSFPDEGFCPLDYGNPRSMESALGFVPDKIQHTNAIPDFKTLRGITNK
ncbi:MAG: hypothetical protein KGL39_54485 [Patescibacteria group bacterium]|nr:hypothetical protein [Patescibacteria group bacterium]